MVDKILNDSEVLERLRDYSVDVEGYNTRIETIRSENNIYGGSNFNHILGNVMQPMCIANVSTMKNPDIRRIMLRLYEENEPILSIYLDLIGNHEEFAQAEFQIREGFFPDVNAGNVIGSIGSPKNYVEYAKEKLEKTG